MIKALMIESGFEIVAEDDYLLYKKLYRYEVFEQYRDRISDMKAMIFRKRLDKRS